ncbi:alpha/beta hydrolase [Candidatus Microgenomates bacterium]|nr:alpha/beta hydrolase [Candidatus Microgenomates bacterium]
MNLRKYGKSPFKIAVIHGGPGAAGEMAPVAIELSHNYGILEPLQTKPTIEEQILELKRIIDQNADVPVILIGWSWGAWLSYLFAARFPRLVNKLILVSSGPFEEKYAQQIMPTRLNRLSTKEREDFDKFVSQIPLATSKQQSKIFMKVGKILSRSDSYNPLPDKTEIQANYQIYNKVWAEAAELRRNGRLLNECKKIKCPVIAIHGDYDPHPAEGVKKPLESLLPNFKFILLSHCGHTPWLEKEAKNKFYQLLKNNLNS